MPFQSSPKSILRSKQSTTEKTNETDKLKRGRPPMTDEAKEESKKEIELKKLKNNENNLKGEIYSFVNY